MIIEGVVNTEVVKRRMNERNSVREDEEGRSTIIYIDSELDILKPVFSQDGLAIIPST